ncbi:MAG: hypothetical protein Q8R82_11965 [Hyphomonadaceae bacterium]|nr:hypothetical protein [Hyphomonadaceae bacterium]
MAIIITNANPAELLKEIYKAIDEKKIITWSYDKDKDFTHATAQWENKAWFRSKIYDNELRFGIYGQKNIELTKEIYAIYHGRFIEMLLAHFDSKFGHAIATSKKTDPDNFT